MAPRNGLSTKINETSPILQFSDEEKNWNVWRVYKYVAMATRFRFKFCFEDLLSPNLVVILDGCKTERKLKFRSKTITNWVKYNYFCNGGVISEILVLLWVFPSAFKFIREKCHGKQIQTLHSDDQLSHWCCGLWYNEISRFTKYVPNAFSPIYWISRMWNIECVIVSN